MPGNGLAVSGHLAEIVRGQADDIGAQKVANAADLCPGHPDPYQRDLDTDGLGDACDDDDGLVTGLRVEGEGDLSWSAEAGVDGYRVRRGVVTSPLATATASCLPMIVSAPAYHDPFLPEGPPAAYFYLVTPVTGGVEGSAGVDSSGVERVIGICQ